MGIKRTRNLVLQPATTPLSFSQTVATFLSLFSFLSKLSVIFSIYTAPHTVTCGHTTHHPQKRLATSVALAASTSSYIRPLASRVLAIAEKLETLRVIVGVGEKQLGGLRAPSYPGLALALALAPGLRLWRSDCVPRVDPCSGVYFLLYPVPRYGGIWGDRDMGDMAGYCGIQRDMWDTARYGEVRRDTAGYGGIQRDSGIQRDTAGYSGISEIL